MIGGLKLANFSERYGFVQEKEIQSNDVDIELFNRIWNIFFNREYESEMWSLRGKIEITEKILDSFGCDYDFPKNNYVRNDNIDKLKKYLLKAEWYFIYDFIEKYVDSFKNASERKGLEKEFNSVLEQEKSGYRMVKGLITPITNSSELKIIKDSMSTQFVSVNTHIEKALKLYSSRKNPDYENSIKESISAIEAMCCIINGSNSTLTDAIKKLKNNGVHIHPAMEKSFISLYGYAGDEKGIRHAGIDFVNAPAEDAKYMLVSCSAFVNYLIEKWSKYNG